MYSINTLDLHFQGLPQTIAAYLVEGPDGHFLIETGPMSTLPELRRQLARHGLDPSDIRHVLVTHIHLDHAGAAGWWAQQGTDVYVHEVGAPHLVDPSRLWKSATRIYGDQMETLWGSLPAAPAERVHELRDGDTLSLCGLTLTALDTPGHASHHHVYLLDDLVFAGDAVGLRLPNSPVVDLPAPPPEFNPELWQLTLERLADLDASTFYPTHFGPTGLVEDQIEQMRQQLSEATTFVEERMKANMTRDELVAEYVAWHRERAMEHGLSEAHYERYELANPLYMSVDGIMRYLRKRQR